MDTKELIERLSLLPLDSKVIFHSHYGGYSEATEIKTERVSIRESRGGFSSGDWAGELEDDINGEVAVLLS